MLSQYDDDQNKIAEVMEEVMEKKQPYEGRRERPSRPPKDFEKESMFSPEDAGPSSETAPKKHSDRSRKQVRQREVTEEKRTFEELMN